MSEAKTMILATVLRFDKPFKVSHVYQLSGLSRELSRYHVLQLVDEGFLEKNGQWYSIIDKDGILNALAKTEEPASRNKLKLDNRFIRKDRTEKINNTIEFAIAMRVYHVPYHNETRLALINEINKTVKALRDLKQYLNHNDMSKRKAKELLLQWGNTEQTWNQVYDVLPELHSVIGKQEWVKEVLEHLGELE